MIQLERKSLKDEAGQACTENVNLLIRQSALSRKFCYLKNGAPAALCPQSPFISFVPNLPPR